VEVRMEGGVVRRQGQGCGVQVVFEAGMSFDQAVRALSKSLGP
jgi:hypothetical protein